jgi:methionyl-tRNA synthetase
VPGPSDYAGGEATADASTPEGKLDAEFFADINAKLAEYRESMEATKIRGGLALAMSISGRGNQFLQDAGLDNALLAGNPERCGQVLLNAINLIYLLSVLFHPFMPTTSTGILRQLNAPARSLPTTFTIDILPGHKLGKAEHLFKKIDNVNGEQERAWQKRFGGDSVVADQVTPAGPGGHPEGGKVPHAKDIKVKSAGKADKSIEKKSDAAKQLEMQKARKEAEKLKEANKTQEERDLEAKVEASGKRVALIKRGQAEGDADEAMKEAKEFKTQLAELRKKLKEAKLDA